MTLRSGLTASTVAELVKVIDAVVAKQTQAFRSQEGITDVVSTKAEIVDREAVSPVQDQEASPRETRRHKASLGRHGGVTCPQCGSEFPKERR